MITLNATHQQTKRLVDPVNGTYQTVLTIDSCVGWSDIVGTYNCTVENDRGESSETVVVPGETWNPCTLTCPFLLSGHTISVEACTPPCHGLSASEHTLQMNMSKLFRLSAVTTGCCLSKPAENV